MCSVNDAYKNKYSKTPIRILPSVRMRFYCISGLLGDLIQYAHQRILGNTQFSAYIYLTDKSTMHLMLNPEDFMLSETCVTKTAFDEDSYIDNRILLWVRLLPTRINFKKGIVGCVGYASLDKSYLDRYFPTILDPLYVHIPIENIDTVVESPLDFSLCEYLQTSYKLNKQQNTEEQKLWDLSIA